jgi:hypothetical protein
MNESVASGKCWDGGSETLMYKVLLTGKHNNIKKGKLSEREIGPNSLSP